MEDYESDGYESEEFELVPKKKVKVKETPNTMPIQTQPKPKKPRKPLTAKQMEALKKGQAIRDRNRLLKQQNKLSKIKQKEKEINEVIKEEPDYLATITYLAKENKKLKKAVKKQKIVESSSSDESDDEPPKRKTKQKGAGRQGPVVQAQPNESQIKYIDSLDKLLLGLRA